MKDMLAALELATTAGTRVSLLMDASSLVLAGCAGHVQGFVRQSQKHASGALSRFARAQPSPRGSAKRCSMTRNSTACRLSNTDNKA